MTRKWGLLLASWCFCCRLIKTNLETPPLRIDKMRYCTTNLTFREHSPTHRSPLPASPSIIILLLTSNPKRFARHHHTHNAAQEEQHSSGTSTSSSSRRSRSGHSSRPVVVACFLPRRASSSSGYSPASLTKEPPATHKETRRHARAHVLSSSDISSVEPCWTTTRKLAWVCWA